jgi:hypothetical protein
MSTPYRFAKETFIKTLKAMNDPKNAKGYYVVRADIKRSKLLSQDTARQTVITAESQAWDKLNPPPPATPTDPNNPTPAAPPTTPLMPAPVIGGIAAPVTPGAVNTLLDRYTREDMSTDSTLEAEVVIVVNDPDAKPAQ